MDLQSVCNYLHLPTEDVVNAYLYGSQVYGTMSEASDVDLIIVSRQIESEINLHSDAGKIDATVYSWDSFQNKLASHEISLLECLYLPPNLILLQSQQPIFNLSLPLLRESLSAKSSNSFVKAKKKLTVEKDFDLHVAKKSLFHSLRILQYGIQIAKEGRIIDYSCANHWWKQISDNPSIQWEDYKKVYQPIYNNLKTEFRLVAPK